ncbi:MAG: hypothetical protein Q8R76_01215 [Candidatus Omnitrophota bacterium]|nr:hypothetical protein [Candidatus Omnitrophota bacterium]
MSRKLESRIEKTVRGFLLRYHHVRKRRNDGRIAAAAGAVRDYLFE